MPGPSLLSPPRHLSDNVASSEKLEMNNSTETSHLESTCPPPFLLCRRDENMHRVRSPRPPSPPPLPGPRPPAWPLPSLGKQVFTCNKEPLSESLFLPLFPSASAARPALCLAPGRCVDGTETLGCLRALLLVMGCRGVDANQTDTYIIQLHIVIRTMEKGVTLQRLSEVLR